MNNPKVITGDELDVQSGDSFVYLAHYVSGIESNHPGATYVLLKPKWKLKIPEAGNPGVSFHCQESQEIIDGKMATSKTISPGDTFELISGQLWIVLGGGNGKLVRVM
jgi:hypothetical protein